MTEDELIRAICKESRKNGVRVTKKQAKSILKAFKDVTYEACKEGKKVRLKGLLTVEGILTRKIKLPNGEFNKPRLKMKVTISDLIQRKFKKEMKQIELEEEFKNIQENGFE